MRADDGRAMLDHARAVADSSPRSFAALPRTFIASRKVSPALDHDVSIRGTAPNRRDVAWWCFCATCSAITRVDQPRTRIEGPEQP